VHDAAILARVAAGHPLQLAFSPFSFFNLDSRIATMNDYPEEVIPPAVLPGWVLLRLTVASGHLQDPVATSAHFPLPP